jgi:mannose-6-phosphate isomerase-like protein (cupin superfamily)
MTTETTSSNAFALAAGEGRTREPLDILGETTLVKLTNADSNGAAVIFHQTVPPLYGPPLHRHSREDEWFYILEGEITAEIDGQRTWLQAGYSAFAPRGTVHTFKNFGSKPAKMLVLVTPGGFNQFFEELSSLHRGLSTPDLEGTARLGDAYGIEVLGPPLS